MHYCIKLVTVDLRLMVMLCHSIGSYLKTLLTPFNEILTKFLDQLKPLAGGSTIVPMKVHFGEFTQDVISKVINKPCIIKYIASYGTVYL